jgi:CAAX protease family protein
VTEAIRGDRAAADPAGTSGAVDPADPTGPGDPAAQAERARRRGIAEQILVVLSLALLESVFFAVITLFEAPVDRTVAVRIFPSFDLARQIVSVVFGLAPVWLVLYLVRRPGEGGLRSIGLDGDRPLADLAWGAALAAIVGTAGLLLYAAAVQLDVNRLVVPVPPLGHWWTIPILVVGAAQNALLEEIVVVGYLQTRLGRLGWTPWLAVIASATLRGAYHLYQGWGGFAGNLALGLFFGWVFTRWGRTWPLIVAHFLLDVGAGLGYIAFCPHAPYC